MQITKQQCPKCAALGKDNHKDNLAVYPDHVYCFSCGYSKTNPLVRLGVSATTVIPSTASSSSSANPTTFYRGSFPDLGDKNRFTSRYPRKVLEWIAKYDIRVAKLHSHKVIYDTINNWLIFPNSSRALISVRNFSGFGPKSYTFKYDSDTVWALCGPSLPMVIVEDVLSAFKISGSFCTLALLGSFISPNICNYIKTTGHDPCCIWLDPDKITEALIFSQKALTMGIKCATIVSDKDPKEYSKLEIERYVSDAITSNSY